MKKAVSPDIVARITERGALGRQAWERGAVEEAEKHFLDAWSILPDPRTEYDYAQSMTRGLVTFYRDTKQFAEALRWLEEMKASYGAEPNASVEFLAGTVYFEAGMLDDAFRIFDSLFRQFRQRPFQGKDKKYLEFYKTRASAPR